MSLLSYNDLLDLVLKQHIKAEVRNINGTSVDITLGNELLIQRPGTNTIIDLQKKETPLMESKFIDSNVGYGMIPGEFLLATTVEIFNLPNNIAAEYKLKSSLARSGLQHLLAGWCDPGWTDSKLTLELLNVSKNILVLKPGMKIGQIIFWECAPVPHDMSYSVKGQYNNQKTVTGNKGLK